jgi:peptidoglycan/LPS O-acetylase OafA/YrhL
MGSSTEPQLTAGQRFIPTLDGWRAIAVMMVIVAHEVIQHQQSVPHVLRPLRHLGGAGVKIFFGISGYLICTLLLAELKKTGTISVRAFYIRRAFRILPAAFAYLAFVSLLSLLYKPYLGVADILSPVFLMANNITPRLLTHHYWSLSLEEQFYLFWPALLAFLRPQRALRASVLIFAALTVWRFIYGAYDDLEFNRSDMVIDVFFAPCAMAILLFPPENRARAVRWLGISAFLAIAASIVALEFAPISDSVRHGVFAILIPLIVIATVLHPEWLLSKALELAPLRWIGRISYSLYLWQQIFTWAELGSTPMIVRMIGLFAVAAVSYYCLETPLIAFGRRLAAEHQARRSPQPAITDALQPIA